MRGVRHLLALGTAAVCGVLLYCLRLRFPNPLTEALGPANASPWETGKLVFWAMLPAAAVLPALLLLPSPPRPKKRPLLLLPLLLLPQLIPLRKAPPTKATPPLLRP